MSVEARDIDNEDDDEWVLQDGKHLRPMVTGCIQAKYCHDTLGLPTRSSNMSDTFSKALSIAYGNEYNMPDIVIFSNSRFLFIKATPIDSQQPATEDPILGSGYWHLQLATPPEETILLYGLPAILPRLLYLVPIASDGPDLISLVDDRATAKEFLWIERTLQWL